MEETNRKGCKQDYKQHDLDLKEMPVSPNFQNGRRALISTVTNMSGKTGSMNFESLGKTCMKSGNQKGEEVPCFDSGEEVYYPGGE